MKIDNSSYLEEYGACEFFESLKSNEQFKLLGLSFKKLDAVSAIAEETPEDQPRSIYGYNETTKIIHFAYFAEEGDEIV
jgi:hypothetical protein